MRGPQRSPLQPPQPVPALVLTSATVSQSSRTFSTLPRLIPLHIQTTRLNSLAFFEPGAYFPHPCRYRSTRQSPKVQFDRAYFTLIQVDIINTRNQAIAAIGYQSL